MNAITTQTAKDDLDNLVDRVNTSPEPKILQNADGQQAVLISLAEFNAWQETIHLLSNPANANRLLQSIQDAEAGKFTEHALIEG
ncbi:MAG: type II toxin-antitoxin system prevent-host-death family antitoxin [Spirulina sp. SIO3F2]|nr:type II toxin-antitoxin system prevent-host-death family antitoxin [Spirulina sp. SIO3F2]